jgi:hypothetical protein
MVTAPPVTRITVNLSLGAHFFLEEQVIGVIAQVLNRQGLTAQVEQKEGKPDFKVDHNAVTNKVIISFEVAGGLNGHRLDFGKILTAELESFQAGNIVKVTKVVTD